MRKVGDCIGKYCYEVVDCDQSSDCWSHHKIGERDEAGFLVCCLYTREIVAKLAKERKEEKILLVYSNVLVEGEGAVGVDMEITSCYDCSYYRRRQVDGRALGKKKDVCYVDMCVYDCERRIIENDSEIPSWCPLQEE